MRVAFGWIADGKGVEPHVDGETLTEIEWQVWREVYVRESTGSLPNSASRAAINASYAVIRMREHFAKEAP